MSGQAFVRVSAQLQGPKWVFSGATQRGQREGLVIYCCLLEPGAWLPFWDPFVPSTYRVQNPPVGVYESLGESSW